MHSIHNDTHTSMDAYMDGVNEFTCKTNRFPFAVRCARLTASDFRRQSIEMRRNDYTACNFRGERSIDRSIEIETRVIRSICGPWKRSILLYTRMLRNRDGCASFLTSSCFLSTNSFSFSGFVFFFFSDTSDQQVANKIWPTHHVHFRDIHTYMHAYIHTCVSAYVHKYTHTYTYIHNIHV
jgi:hypothetical protein